MAHQATLTVEKKKYNLLECSYEFKQEMEEYARPTERPSGGEINFTIVSPDDSDMFFHDWMKGYDNDKDGEIKMSVVGNKGDMTTRTLKFKKAYCIFLSESFNAYGGEEDATTQMYTKLKIMAAQIAFGGDNESIVIVNDEKS